MFVNIFFGIITFFVIGINKNERVVDSDLKVDTLTFAASTLDEETKKIETNNFLADYASIMVIFDPKYIKYSNNIKTNQFTFYTSQDYDIRNDKLIGYNIIFDENSFQYQMVFTDENDEYEISLINTKDIPNSFANSLGIIPKGDCIKLISSSSNVKNVKDVNITYKDYDPFDTSYSITNPIKYEYTVTHEILFLVQDGDWSGVTNKPKILLSYDKNVTEIDKEEINIEIKEVEFYDNFTSKKDQLFDSPPEYGDIIVPGEDVVVIDVTNKNNESIQNTIDDTLSKGFEDSSSKNNKVVEIKEPITFTSNKEYYDNQWIKFSSSSTIKLDGGNINVVLPNQGEITIEANDANDINLSITGQGTVVVKSTDESQKSFNITGKSLISGETSIIVPDKSINAIIQSVDLIDHGSIKVKDQNGNDVHFTVNSIQVQSRTSTTSLNNMRIGSSLTIPQSSSIKLDNVDVDGITIFNYLIAYANFNQPLITGTFNGVPAGILVNGSNAAGGEPTPGDNFVIAHGTFKCKDWLNSLDISKTLFTNKLCQDREYAKLLDDVQNLIMNIPGTLKPEGGGDNDNGDNSDKIHKIIMIVSICIVILVIAAIASCIACCVCKNKKRKLNKDIKTTKSKKKEKKHHHQDSEDEDDEAIDL